ncbi:Hsp70 family protein [candidate division KSB1 bacterium]|nr:Hsp70 family protein [candidate division KSB1 bacterium]
MKYALGIDLGTTNSVVSVYRKGKVESLSIEGSKTVPSVVGFKDKDTMLVGKMAKPRVIIDPEHSIVSVKRFMGDRRKRYSIYGIDYSPVDVSSIILKKLVEGAEKALGEKVKDVIITVPAYFTDAQKEDTRKAGEKAGLNVLRLLPEPTAAAISYGLDKGKDQTIMVYDLGGGTFDVSILDIKGNKFNVKAVDGNSQLGGDDFDNKIVDFLIDELNQLGKDIKNDNSKEAKLARQKLKEAAERAKIELSEAQSTHIIIPEILGVSLDVELTLQKYNKLIDEYLKDTISKIRSVLKSARMTPEDIDRVILVGGSTRNKAIKEIVTKEIKEPWISEHVDEAVSHGAALLAASLTLPEQDFSPAGKLEYHDRTGHSLGVELLDERNHPFFRPIIVKNTEYPVQQGILAWTVRAFQEQVRVQVFRGENKDCKLNTKLGELLLSIRNLSKDQVPIGAIFDLDQDGILHFYCVELPINIGEQQIIKVVQHAINNGNFLDVESVRKLMESKMVQFLKTEIKSVE